MRRRWCAVFVTLLALVGALVLPACELDVADVSSGEATQTESQAEAAQDEAQGEDAAAADEADDDATDAEDATAEDASSDKGVSGTSSGLSPGIAEDGEYTSKEEVALYLHTFGHLPSNYVTKEEAEDAGWKTEGLSLAEACPGKSIGGDRFGNREKRLPTAKGRTWYECDIDYAGERSRNAKRLVYSSDGLIYYTEDHYQTFEQLY